jgi:hypothetical protein
VITLTYIPESPYPPRTATFHTTHTPAPLDPFYMRGPWLAWLRCGGICNLTLSGATP